MPFCSRTNNTITCFCWVNVHAFENDPVEEKFFMELFKYYQNNERGYDRLLNTTNSKILRNLSTYIFLAFEYRTERLYVNR